MSTFEQSVNAWLVKHDYKIVKENEEISIGKTQYQVRIHALSANKEQMKYAKIAAVIGVISALAVFGGKSVPALAGMMKDLGKIFGIAGPSFSVLLLIAGLFFYFSAKSKVDEHVWIDLKDGKVKVNKTQIQKFYAMVEDTRKLAKNDDKMWSTKYPMLFSSKGFSAQALQLAESHQIDCVTWQPDSNEFVREVWSQVEPEATTGEG